MPEEYKSIGTKIEFQASLPDYDLNEETVRDVNKSFKECNVMSVINRIQEAAAQTVIDNAELKFTQIIDILKINGENDTLIKQLEEVSKMMIEYLQKSTPDQIDTVEFADKMTFVKLTFTHCVRNSNSVASDRHMANLF